MKLPVTSRCLSKSLKVLIVLIAFACLPLSSWAQAPPDPGCGGGIGMQFYDSDGQKLDDVRNSPHPFLVQMNPASAAGNLDIFTPILTVALTCQQNAFGDPGTDVSCVNGVDQQALTAGVTPLTFKSWAPPAGLPLPPYDALPWCNLVAGGAGTTYVLQNNDGVTDAQVVFNFVNDPDNNSLDEMGCVIAFTADINDKGIDDPQWDLDLHMLSGFFGQCANPAGGFKTGSAQGSNSLLLLDPICIPEIDVCVAVDTDHDNDFDDEFCGPDMVGLNATSVDTAKPYKFFVEGDLGTDSQDLDDCQVQFCDQPPCTEPGEGGNEWTPVTSDFTLDGPIDLNPLLPLPTIDGLCSAGLDERAYRISCDICGPDPDEPSMSNEADASVECVDCSVTMDKQVNCDDKTGTWGETCVGWYDDDLMPEGAETWYRYRVTNDDTGRSVDVTSCEFDDGNALIDPIGTPGGLPLVPGESSDWVEYQNDRCQDGEGSTNGVVNCACLPTIDGQDIVIGPNSNVVGDNDNGTDWTPPLGPDGTPGPTWGLCSADAEDPATLVCESVSLGADKVCDEQDEGGDNAIRITVTNAAEVDGVKAADLTNCAVVDTLTGGTPVDVTCYDGIGSDTVVALPGAKFTIPGATGIANTVYECRGSVNGLTESTINNVVVTCEVEDTGKVKTARSSDECEVERDGCYTRTPGFWGTHPHIADLFLDVEVCGNTHNTTDAGPFEEPTDYDEPYPSSTTEDMCSVGKDAKSNNLGSTTNTHVQLLRQCTAAALNIAATQAGGAQCRTVSDTNNLLIAEVFDSCCNTLCTSDPTEGDINASGCIDDLDEFNNSDDIPFDWDGDDPFVSPGPADSSQCRSSKNNGFLNWRESSD